MLDNAFSWQTNIDVTNPSSNIACNTLTYVFAEMGLPALLESLVTAVLRTDWQKHSKLGLSVLTGQVEGRLDNARL